MRDNVLEPCLRMATKMLTWVLCVYWWVGRGKDEITLVLIARYQLNIETNPTMRQPPNVYVVVYLVEETLEHLGCLDGERARDTDCIFKNNCST